MIVDQLQSEYRIVLLIQPGKAESALHGMLLLFRVFISLCNTSSDSQTQLVKLLNSSYEIV